MMTRNIITCVQNTKKSQLNRSTNHNLTNIQHYICVLKKIPRTL